MKRLLIVSLCGLIVFIRSYGQIYKEGTFIGVIQDSDGFVNMREEPNSKSTVIKKVIVGDFVQFRMEDSTGWYAAFDLYDKSGFIHNSRIFQIDQLERSYVRQLLLNTFDEMINTKLTDETIDVWEKRDMLYHPSLYFMIKYLDNDFDQEVFRSFLDVIQYEKGSADEFPSTALGYVCIDSPKDVIEILYSYNDPLLLNLLQFGVGNASSSEGQWEAYREIVDSLDAVDKSVLNFGVIKDVDGFVNVRIDSSLSSDISAQIPTGELVCLSGSHNSNWVFINDGKGNLGYVHESRVIELNSLGVDEKLTCIIKSIKTEQYNFLKFQSDVSDKKSRNIFRTYHDRLFIPVMAKFIECMELDYNLSTVDIFLDVMVSEIELMDNNLGKTLGQLYRINSSATFSEVVKKNNQKLLEELYYGVELLNSLEGN